MAAVAPSNSFSIFIQKIGFSVGLEHTLDRLRDFAEAYSARDTFTAADVSRLLHEKWGLKRQNEHILDVLRSLNIVTVAAGNVSVLETGEALGILRRMVVADSHFDKVLRFLFLQTLIRSDGDIFLNALAADFEPEEFKARATRMLEHKWSILEAHFKTPGQLAAVYRGVNIEAQENNPGSSRGSSLASRTKPDPYRLQTRTGPLQVSASRPDIRISDAYLTKALPRRKAWAVSLGLADVRGTVTDLGKNVISTIAGAGYAGPSCIAMWPLLHELQTPALANFVGEGSVPLLTSWDYLHLVGRSLDLLPEAVLPQVGGKHATEALDRLVALLHVYRSLNVTKSITRIELPIRVAYQCVLGLATGGSPVLNYPKIIEAEQNKPFPKIIARKSKLAEYALSSPER